MENLRSDDFKEQALKRLFAAEAIIQASAGVSQEVLDSAVDMLLPIENDLRPNIRIKLAENLGQLGSVVSADAFSRAQDVIWRLTDTVENDERRAASETLFKFHQQKPIPSITSVVTDISSKIPSVLAQDAMRSARIVLPDAKNVTEVLDQNLQDATPIDASQSVLQGLVAQYAEGTFLGKLLPPQQALFLAEKNPKLACDILVSQIRGNGDWNVNHKASAIKALMALGRVAGKLSGDEKKPVIQALITLAKDPLVPIQSSVAEVLAQIDEEISGEGSKTAMSIFLRMANDPKDSVQKKAAEALGRVGGETVGGCSSNSLQIQQERLRLSLIPP